jgi:hypothetical protein
VVGHSADTKCPRVGEAWEEVERGVDPNS